MIPQWGPKKEKLYEAVEICVAGAGVHPMTESTNSSDWERLSCYLYRSVETVVFGASS